MKRFLRNNGLSLTLAALFLLFRIAQTYFGWRVDSEDRELHGGAASDFISYLGTGHF